MSDERLRELEREWQQFGTPQSAYSYFEEEHRQGADLETLIPKYEKLLLDNPDEIKAAQFLKKFSPQNYPCDVRDIGAVLGIKYYCELNDIEYAILDEETEEKITILGISYQVTSSYFQDAIQGDEVIFKNLQSQGYVKNAIPDAEQGNLEGVAMYLRDPFSFDKEGRKIQLFNFYYFDKEDDIVIPIKEIRGKTRSKLESHIETRNAILEVALGTVLNGDINIEENLSPFQLEFLRRISEEDNQNLEE